MYGGRGDQASQSIHQLDRSPHTYNVANPTHLLHHAVLVGLLQRHVTPARQLRHLCMCMCVFWGSQSVMQSAIIIDRIDRSITIFH